MEKIFSTLMIMDTFIENFIIPVLHPFRLDLTVWALKRTPENHMESWDGNKYSRVLLIKNTIFRIEVIQNDIKLEVKVTSNRKIENIDKIIFSKLKNMLGIEKNLNCFYKMAFRDNRFRLLSEKFRGFRPPCFPNVFEAAINAISCQQLSLRFGITLLNKLSQRYGQKFEEKHFRNFAFPGPGNLKDISLKEMKKMGFSFNKARAIKELAAAVFEKKIDLTIIKKMPDEEVKKITSSWNPYADVVYFHLLLNKLEKMGAI